MTKLKLKQTVLKCLLNYRIIFAYFMATTFFFMHYFVVTSSQFESDDQMMAINANEIINERLNHPHRPRFNSKKLLNFINSIFIDSIPFELMKYIYIWKTWKLSLFYIIQIPYNIPSFFKHIILSNKNQI